MNDRLHPTQFAIKSMAKVASHLTALGASQVAGPEPTQVATGSFS
jgi:hypothetical protein